MTDDEIIDLLRVAVASVHARHERDVVGLLPEVAFADLGVDSIGLLETAAFLEDKLGLRFPDERVTSIATVKQFIEMVHEGIHGRKNS